MKAYRINLSTGTYNSVYAVTALFVWRHEIKIIKYIKILLNAAYRQFAH